VGIDERFLKNAGKDLSLLKGVISNEGSYGVETGEDEAKRLEALFGSNWRDAVPINHVAAGKNIPPFLLFHVSGENTRIANTRGQATGLGNALRAAGIRAEVMPLDHVEHFGANERIGEPGDITTVSVERFLDSITGRETPAEWQSARPLGRRN